jgi:presenilin-like A22 family membrane protease
MEETLTIYFVLLMEETLTIYFVLLVTLFNKQKLFRCLIVVVIRYIHTPPT